MPKWFDWLDPNLASPFVVSVSIPLNQVVLLAGLVIFLHSATFCSLIGIGQRLIALEIEREEGAA